jgi:HD-GYP domain-containing protein (c-di-GMP phosphodiesterase class II)
MFKMVPMSTLRIGAVLASPLFDQSNTKLLAAGIPISDPILDKLRERGVSTVAVHEADLSRLTAFQPQGTAATALPDRSNIRHELETRVSRQLDLLSELQLDLNACRRGEPFSKRLPPPEPRSYDREGMNELAARHQSNIKQLDSTLESLAAGNAVDLKAVSNISENILMQALLDKDLFVCLGISPAADSYPGRHSMHTSMLATSIGATLGLDQQTLAELGLGCLIHDAGMLQIDSQSFQTRRVLSPGEFCEITKHPLRTFELLERNLDQVPASSRMVAYQIHERCDGSGYPRGKASPQIHPLAKIAGVADAFTALVAKRPHRPGLLPYHALVKLLRDANSGLYDKAIVRGLLQTVSLFPIGSHVAMSDGRVGKVIRANASYDRPILEVWRRDHLEAPPQIVDLAQAEHAELRVTRALMRLR